MNDLISIIVPVYNVEEYIRKCLQSLINQTYNNLEIILVNDGSSDNSGKICDEYAKIDFRIKVIHKKNGGVSSARNAGLDIANGDYIGFIDPDDYIKEDAYETLLTEIKSGEYDIVECNYYKVYEDGTQYVNENKDAVYNNYKEILYAALTYNLATCVWNKLYKREVIGDIRFNPEYRVAEDMLFFFECAKKGSNLKFINTPLNYYLIRDMSAMRKPFNRGHLDVLTILEYIEPDCEDDKLLKAFNSYYLPNLVNVSQNIVGTGLFTERKVDIRKKIIKNKKNILLFKDFKVNGKTCSIRGVNKLYVLMLWLFPWCVYKLYPLYLKFRNKA